MKEVWPIKKWGNITWGVAKHSTMAWWIGFISDESPYQPNIIWYIDYQIQRSTGIAWVSNKIYVLLYIVGALTSSVFESVFKMIERVFKMIEIFFYENDFRIN